MAVEDTPPVLALPPAALSIKRKGKQQPPAVRPSSSKDRSSATAETAAKAPRAASQPQTVRSAASYVPEAGAPLSAANIAAHGQLYDYISFPNIPQWVSMCIIPFNAYRLASQSSDRAAQDQAVEDILMLPQRVLTRTGRGPGDHRRLNRVMRARCQTQGERLRQRYDSQPARDRNVQLNKTAGDGPTAASCGDSLSCY